MGAMKRMEYLWGITPARSKRERGQILVLVAIAMVGLLVAAGIAVDVGFLLMRKSQFDRAVDAAALTGVTVVSMTDPDDSLAIANERGRQLLGANGIPITDLRTSNCSADGTLPVDNPDTAGVDESRDYCGLISPGMMPGATRYRVQARWWVPTFFMNLIKINAIPLIGDATAEYFPVVDMYASTNDQGLIQAAVLSEWGPDSCTANGDAYTSTVRGNGDSTPPNLWYSELGGAYTFRIAIPAEADFPYDKLRVELLDPDGRNLAHGDNPSPDMKFYRLNGTTGNGSCSSRTAPCALGTSDTINPFWFVDMDESRGSSSGVGHSCVDVDYYPARTTRTLYRLFYYKMTGPGTLDEVDLAYYVGEDDIGNASTPGTHAAEAKKTDRMWVSPGATGGELAPSYPKRDTPAYPQNQVTPGSDAEPLLTTPDCTAILSTYAGKQFLPGTPGGALDKAKECVGDGNFIINLKDISPTEPIEVPNMYIDPNRAGMRDIFLQVIALDGASENGFSLWAGPAYTATPAAANIKAPAYVNARQLQLIRDSATIPDEHSSNGVVVYAMGHMSMNWLADSRVRFPLTYLGSEFSGQKLEVSVFDTWEAETCWGCKAKDSSPLYFFFDTLATTDWSACFAHAQNDCTSTADPIKFPGSQPWAFHDCIVPSDPTGGNGMDGEGLPSPPYPKENGGDCIGKDSGTGDHDHPDMQDHWGIFRFKIPTQKDEDIRQQIPFYGGRLYVSYKGSLNESATWKMTVDARPTLVH